MIIKNRFNQKNPMQTINSRNINLNPPGNGVLHMQQIHIDLKERKNLYAKFAVVNLILLKI